MSANLALLQERFVEVAATSTLDQLAKQLSTLATQPSTKAFGRQRPLAAELWASVRELAAQRAAAAAKPVKAKVAAKPRAATPPPANTPIVGNATHGGTDGMPSSANAA